MTTTPITRALRKSTLIEYKILERTSKGKISKVQEGWQLTKHDDHVVVSHSAMNWTTRCFLGSSRRAEHLLIRHGLKKSILISMASI